MKQATRVDRFARAWLEHDALVYAGFVVVCTVFSASAFYGYMLLQTKGVWSAPLDDVFIHFDYARSFARGYPFQWTEGNGYSSGNTSLSYPAVLALGHWLGFEELRLVLWSAIVAQLSVCAFLLQAGRLVDGYVDRLGDGPRRELAWLKYLLPPTVLSVGALDWTLWSGMENAWHLGLWGLVVGALLRQLEAEDLAAARRRAWLTGAASLLLVATRPESAVCAAAFGLLGAWHARRAGLAKTGGATLSLLVATGLPPLGLLVVQSLLNKAFTGEYAANGAIAKLLPYQPYMDRAERLRFYRELLGYIVPRVLHHHLADGPPWGYLVPALGLVPLASARLRPVAICLWSQILGWVLLISANMQVRWQNERYAMPATAWLLLLAAMGLGLVAAADWRPTKGVRARAARLWSRLVPLRALAAVAIAVVFWRHQEPRMRDQIWFFGRASRNIFDQQLTAGHVLGRMNGKRVLVGDAGALLYASDLPGIDLIGLGGYHRYPFARATLHGLGAAIEQLERMPVDERPDLMALYPSWWGDLPTYFGRFLVAIPVVGNVICGGAEKVIYRADWSPLDREGEPRTLSEGERVVDELDVADLTSEAEHRHDLPRPGLGFVTYRVLADPRAPEHDLFDAGRLLPPGAEASAELAMPGRGGRLLLRVAPERETSVEIVVSGGPTTTVMLPAATGSWVEASVELPAGLPARTRVTLRAVGEVAVHHAWTVARPGD